MKMNRAAAFAAALALSVPTPVGAQSIAETFEKVRGSVVVIETKQKDLSPLAAGKLVTVEGIGSGVLVDRLGVILTAAHVVQAVEEIKVQFENGDVYAAKVIASEPNADVAAIKLERPPTGVTVAKLGNSDESKVGEQVFIVGAPLGISYTLSVGYIGARRKANQVWGGLSEAELFQTDAVINHGNSGGPMFNLKGEVIGIVSSMISKTGGWEGLGFVVTSNMARRLVLEQRSMWSGFEGYILSDELARAFNLPQSYGILVQRVAENSPAARLGLKGGILRGRIEDEELIMGGDVVLEVLGVPIAPDNRNRIHSMIDNLVPGERITVTVLRSGQRVELRGVPIPTS